MAGESAFPTLLLVRRSLSTQTRSFIKLVDRFDALWNVTFLRTLTVSHASEKCLYSVTNNFFLILLPFYHQNYVEPNRSFAFTVNSSVLDGFISPS